MDSRERENAEQYARERLREKAQNEATCIALSGLFNQAQIEIASLTAEVERLHAELAARECKDCKRAWEASPVAWYRPTSDGGYEGPLMDSDDRMCTTRRKVWQPLYTRPFQPDWVNYRQGFRDGVNDARSELKQLCSDFSDLRDRPYMGDVHAQIDAVTEQMLKQMPLPPEPKP